MRGPHSWGPRVVSTSHPNWYHPSMPATTTKIGQSVREQRTAANMTHEQLACLVGCDGNTIGRVERGEGDPSVRVLKRISEVFGMGIDEMINTSQPTFAAEMARCVRMMVHLWEERIEDVLRILSRSARNDDVAAFFHDMSARIEGNAFRESMNRFADWSNKKVQIEKIMMSENDRNSDGFIRAKAMFKEHMALPMSQPVPLGKRVEGMLDLGQRIIVEKIFSPTAFISFDMSRFHLHMEHFISVLEA